MTEHPVCKRFLLLQQGFQTFLLLLALACVPWMLLVKPFLLRQEHLGKIKLGGDTEPLSVRSGDIMGDGGESSHQELVHHEEGMTAPATEHHEEEVWRLWNYC